MAEHRTKVDFVGAENSSFSCIETVDYNAFEEALSHVPVPLATSAMRVGVERTHEIFVRRTPSGFTEQGGLCWRTRTARRARGADAR